MLIRLQPRDVAWPVAGESGCSPAFRGGRANNGRPDRGHLPCGDEVLKNHLSGDLQAGIYSLKRRDTYLLRVCDFDGPGSVLDSLAYLDPSRASGIPDSLGAIGLCDGRRARRRQLSTPCRPVRRTEAAGKHGRRRGSDVDDRPYRDATGDAGRTGNKSRVRLPARTDLRRCAGRTIPTLSLCIWPESPVTEGERALSRPNRSWNAPGNILDGVEVDQDRTGRGDIDDGPGARTQCYPLTDIGVSSPLGGL